MRLAPVILRLREANIPSIGNYVAGAAELVLALQNTLLRESIFVVPLEEFVEINQIDSGISQTMIERFGVIVALKNDQPQSEKTGFLAFDRVHEMREKVFNCIVGWNIPGGEGMIYYRGGRISDVNPAYLWYQFEFEFKSRIGLITQLDNGNSVYGLQESGFEDGEAVDWNSIYTRWRLAPARDYDVVFPSNPADDPSPDMAQWIDMTQRPYDGSFIHVDFGSSFNRFDQTAFQNRRE